MFIFDTITLVAHCALKTTGILRFKIFGNSVVRNNVIILFRFFTVILIRVACGALIAVTRVTRFQNLFYRQICTKNTYYLVKLFPGQFITHVPVNVLQASHFSNRIGNNNNGTCRSRVFRI
jgi:hypothetical protein